MLKKFKKIKKFLKQKGFTLVELLAVIVILAIIMLIAIPAVLSTLEAAKRKAFVEYVDKIFVEAQKQVLEENMTGDPIVGCKTFYIKKDLGINNTGNYDGFVLVKNDGFNDIAYYITMHDDDYRIESYLYDGSLDANNLLKYSKAEEVDYEFACAVVGCSSCSSDEDMSASEVCSNITQVNDSTPGTFSGSGTSKDPYKIESIEDLVALSKGTNDGSLGANKYYKLMVDLSFACDKSYNDPSSTTFGDINDDGTVDNIKTELTTSFGWVPIGNEEHPFSSTIDGNNKKIYGLYINSGMKYKYTAFLGYSAADKNDSFIGNISLLDANVNAGGNYNGIVLSYGTFKLSSGKVENIKTSGNLVCNTTSNESRLNCSPIVPYVDAKVVYNEVNGNTSSTWWEYGEVNINNLLNKANVTSNSKYYSGGTVAYVDHLKVEKVYNYGNIDAYSYSGGTLGYVDSSSLSEIYNYGDVACRGASCAGTIGIVYYSDGDKAYNYGKVVGHNNNGYFGGVISDIAYNNEKNLLFTNIYNYGDITSKNSYTGGCIGNIYHSTVYNSYNYGNVEYNGGDYAQIGGITGHVNYGAKLYNSGNHGTITSNGRFSVGGIAGYGEGTISNVYNYGKIIVNRNNTSGSIAAGGLIGSGSCSNCYSIADIENNGNVSNYDSDQFGIVFGQNRQSANEENIFGVGTITNNLKRSSTWYKYYGLIGSYSTYRNTIKKNYYGKVNLIGFPNVGVFAGYNSYGDITENIYIDMYTDASNIYDNSSEAPADTYPNYYANLNDSPNKSAFTLAQEYDFSQVDGMWFRDKLRLGNNWMYSSGYYPKLYKVLPNGSVSNELVNGQKDIAIK